jgi:tol-pal system-associated acyl-CoA thioesterase
MGGFTLPVRVYLEDTDAQGVVYNASYFRFMERARTEWLRERGIDHGELRDRLGLAVVLTGIEARFRSPARLGDLLEVGADVVAVRGARVVFEQIVRRSDEKDLVLCAGKAEVACMGATDGRPRRWPENLLRELTR